MSGGACATIPGERIGRGVVAIITAAFAINVWPNLWCVIPAGLCTLCLAVGAITGWCPTSLFQRTPAEPEPNDLGIPEARGLLTFDPTDAPASPDASAAADAPAPSSPHEIDRTRG